MRMPARLAVLFAWLLALAVAVTIFARAPFLTDMSIFLPAEPDQRQALFVDSLADGAAAHTLLARVSGVTPIERASFSNALAAAWRARSEVRAVLNGADSGFEADARLLFEHRYLLSPRVDEQRFAPDSLRIALEGTLASLATSFGLMGKEQLLRDPTGETLAIVDAFVPRSGPRTEDGVWVDPGGDALLFMIETNVSGNDLDAQERLLAGLDQDLASVRDARGVQAASLEVTGAARFAVDARRTIRDDVIRLSAIGSGLILLLLGYALRSPLALGLTLVPMVTAVLTGAAAVALGFGSVHGLTLGFGAALVGETVDYAIYRLAAPGGRGLWASIGIGLATSVVGFIALLFAGFPGLSQLAVFAIAGLCAGFAAARWVLPALAPRGFEPRGVPALGRRLALWVPRLRIARVPVIVATAIACIWLAADPEALWQSDAAALSPVDAGAIELDTRMREALREEGGRMAVLVQTDRGEAALLEASAAAAGALQRLVDQGVLSGFDAPSAILPPPSVQRARQAALPDAQALRSRLELAAAGLPLASTALSGFVADVDAARSAPMLTRADFDGTRLGLRLDGMIVQGSGARLTAILPLRDAPGMSVPVSLVDDAMPALPDAQVRAIEFKAEIDRLYGGYLNDSISSALVGALAIVALVAIYTRSWRRTLEVCLPVACAVVLVVAGLAVVHGGLNLLHLVGLLLVVAIGSNYALVLSALRARADADAATLGSLALANLTTLCGYGALAASSVPLLSALGTTVGLGAPLVLLLSLLWLGHDGRAGDAGRRLHDNRV